MSSRRELIVKLCDLVIWAALADDYAGYRAVLSDLAGVGCYLDYPGLGDACIDLFWNARAGR